MHAEPFRGARPDHGLPLHEENSAHDANFYEFAHLPGARASALDFDISTLSRLTKRGVPGQPKDRINDEVGRTLDELPHNIEVDPKLRTQQRQNE